MCTAITYNPSGHFFGRNLDYDYTLPSVISIMPRNYQLRFRNGQILPSHYAMIGMAIIEDDYPLYFDAVNEWGVSIAGLNFPGNAVYLSESKQHINIAPFELIPWILGQCKTVQRAEELLQSVNLVNTAFREDYPLTPLHWMISDQRTSITVEPTVEGIRIYNNPVGVLTNNPPFDYHMNHLVQYLNLSRNEAENRLFPGIDLVPYSRGMGAVGLPGDYSSSSRFIKAVFTSKNAAAGQSEIENISQVFHILDSVTQIDGCVAVGSGFEKTLYSSCCNMDTGVYYYTTYENRQIHGISMFQVNLEECKLFHYPMKKEQRIVWET